MNQSYLTKLIALYHRLNSIPIQWQKRVTYLVNGLIMFAALIFVPYSFIYPSETEATRTFYILQELVVAAICGAGIAALLRGHLTIGKVIGVGALLLPYVGTIFTIGVKDYTAGVVFLVINVMFVLLLNPFTHLALGIPLLIWGTANVQTSYAMDSMSTAWVAFVGLVVFSTLVRLLLASLQELIELLKLFAKIFNHDLKPYFEALNNFFEQTQDKYITQSEILELVPTALNALSLLKDRVETMVKIMVAATGAYTPTYKAVLVNDTVTKIAETLVESSSTHKDLVFKVDFPQHEVLADTGILDIAFHNLVTNALKHSTSKVEIKGWMQGDKLVIEVVDDGKGIERNDLQNIFYAGYQTKEGKEKGGTGLGLNFVKRLVTACKGEVWVQSEVGKGSTFGFSLPYKPAA